MSNTKLPTVKNTKSCIVSLTFLWDEGNDKTLFKILTPPDISDDDIARILHNTHKNLCNMTDSENEYDYYGNEGRNANTLLWYINKKYGWEYKPVTADIEMEFN